MGLDLVFMQESYVLAQMVTGLAYLREALLRAGQEDPGFRRKMFDLVDKVVEGQALSPEDTAALGALLEKLRHVDPDFRSRIA